MKRASIAFIVIALVAAACSSDSSDSTEETEASVAPTTGAAPTTTAAPPTTTSPKTTTTEAVPAGEPVPATPVIGVLQPYNEAGAALFPPGSVEAHWYQSDGLYVVLYRGWDAANQIPMCPGNSVSPEPGNWTNVSNSPFNGQADEICIGAPKIADEPSGAYACDSLLYYITEIPTDVEGTLFGTLELADGEFAGHTSQAPVDLASTPEFKPGLTAYELPASGVDQGGLVDCS